METSNSQIEQVTLSDLLELDSWNRERSDEELKSFIEKREALLSRVSL